MSINRCILALALACAPDYADAAPRVTGIASWYGERHQGHITASGCPFDANALSAASLTVPIGAWVRVRRLRSNRWVIVPVTDRGPYVRGRIIDLSRTAAGSLGMIAEGIVLVSVERLDVKPLRGCASGG